MKKVFVFFLLVACICATSLTKIENNPLYAFADVDKVCFVSDHAYEELDYVQCGNLFFNYCTLNEANENLATYKQEAKAVQFEFLDVELQTILDVLQANIVSASLIDDLQMFCFYTPYGDESFYVDGKKANGQIAVSEEKIIVGFPAIYTGF